MNNDPKKRVMMLWYTTVLPALKQLELSHDVQRAFVVEDTCLLAQWCRELTIVLANMRPHTFEHS
jgi:hypothetical protein